MNDIVLATHNPGKMKEFEKLAQGSGIHFVPVSGIESKKEVVEETESTYEGNAWLKAKAIGDHQKAQVIADDSGIEAQALHGKPGVHSARYTKGSDLDRCRHLLNEMDGKEDRKAKFVCVLVYYNFHTGLKKVFRGECTGTIAMDIRGDHGFGYDPVFIPDGYEQTMAQLGAEIKNTISHRSKAIFSFLEWWKTQV